jgi:hypothetical protein
MIRRMSTLASALSLLVCVLPLGGCVTAKFQVVDAKTKQPLRNVGVIRSDVHTGIFLNHTTIAESVLTGADGKLTSVAPGNLGWNIHNFIFSKKDYHTAEVHTVDNNLVPGNRNWEVKSPADDPTIGWLPIPANDVILVPMSPNHVAKPVGSSG